MRKTLIILFLGLTVAIRAQYMIEVQVDKKVIHPEQLGMSDDTSLDDILRVLPELLDRSDGSVADTYSLKIDGTDVSQSKETLLRQLQLGEIESIEVTKTPTVSEQQNGTGGSINVKLRPLKEGLSGNAMLGLSTRFSVNPGVLLDYRKGIFSLRSSVLLDYTNSKSSVYYESYKRMQPTDPHRTRFDREERRHVQQIGEMARVDMRLNFNKRDELKFLATQTVSHREGESNWTGASTTPLTVVDTLMRFRTGTADETALLRNISTSAQLKYSHSYLNNLGKLELTASYAYNPNLDTLYQIGRGEFYRTYLTGDTIIRKNVRTAAHQANFEGSSNFKWSSPQAHNFELKVGMNANYKQANRYPIGDEMISHYTYLSPYVDFTYTYRTFKLKAGARYAYDNRLVYNPGQPGVRVTNHDVSASLQLGYRVADHHLLRLALSRDLTRVSDVAILLGRDSRNNPTYNANLDYAFDYQHEDHKLMLSVGAQYTFHQNVNRSLIGYSSLGKLEVSLVYNYRIFSMAFIGNCFGIGRYDNDTEALIDRYMAYNLSLMPIVHLKRGWDLSGRLTYNSKVTTFNSYLSDCFYAQIRVNKHFNNHWSVYAYIDDIFDYWATDKVYSGKDFELQKYDMYTRAFAIGANYKF